MNIKIHFIECEKCKRKIGNNNFKKHYEKCDGNPIPKKKRKGRGIYWSKGKTYLELFGEERAKEIIEKSKKHNTFRFLKHTEESKKKISKGMIGNKNWEGSVSKSGRGKKGHYKGEFFMSTWELAYMVYQIEHNVKFERNWKKFEYMDLQGNKRYYVPDFIVNNIYVEIKGYMTKEVELKINSFKHPLIVLGKDEIKPILDYVIDKYGNNFYDILKDK